jgi:hypothetical protein
MTQIKIISKINDQMNEIKIKGSNDKVESTKKEIR